MKKSKANGNHTANAVVKKLCQAIEATLNPIRLLITTTGCSMQDDVDLTPCIEKFAQALDPTYEELKAELAQEGLRSNAAVGVYCIERYAWFAAGHLMGMAQSGRPMEEIRKVASSIVARG